MFDGNPVEGGIRVSIRLPPHAPWKPLTTKRAHCHSRGFATTGTVSFVLTLPFLSSFLAWSSFILASLFIPSLLDAGIEFSHHLSRVGVYRVGTVEQRRETEALTKAIDELRTGECELRTELERTMRDKSELETLLDTAAALARQHMSRENLALAKVQEALQIADSAIEEKNCVVRREQDAREECDFLASTIGQVMEEAARKVEHELGGLRSGYERRIGELERALDQTRSTLETQVQRTSQAETRARTVEEKFRALLKTNQNLDTDLRAASKMIVRATHFFSPAFCAFLFVGGVCVAVERAGVRAWPTATFAVISSTIH